MPSGDIDTVITERVPPQATDIEAKVLGAFMADWENTKRNVELLTLDCFYLTKHQHIFKAIQSLDVQQEPVDTATIRQALIEAEQLDKAGGSTYVLALADEVGTTAHVEAHCRLLQEKAALRRLIHAGTELAHRAYDPRWTVEELIREITPKLIPPLHNNEPYWRIEKFVNWPEPMADWIVEPFIRPRDVMFMVSDSGVGKTWLLLDMMLKVSTGRNWLGRFKTKKTNVLYADFDGHADGALVRERIKSIMDGMGLDPPYTEFHQNCAVLTGYYWPAGINLYKGQYVADFKRAITQGEFGLVIIETFVDIHGSDNENDNAKMVVPMKTLRQLAIETGAGIVIAHHTKKPQPGDNGNGPIYRGSGTIKSKCDCMVALEPEKQGIIRVIHAKPRSTKKLDDFAISITQPPDEQAVIVQCEDDDKLEATRKQIVKSWLLHDLWDTDEAKIAVHNTEGRILQKVIIRLVSDAKVASDKTTREVLAQLKDEGIMDWVEGTRFGKRKCDHFWGVI